MKMNYITTTRGIVLLVGMMILFALYMQYMVSENTERLKQEEIHKTEVYAKHIADWIIKRTDGKVVERLERDPALRTELNSVIETFLMPQYQYIFLLRKDASGHYRFVLDGSKRDKEEYGTLFFPKSDLFDTVYKDGKIRIVKQKDEVNGVWLSLLYPLRIAGKTEALLVLDLSEWYGNNIENFNSPLNRLIHLMQVFLLFVFFTVLYLAYRYYRFRQKILVDPLTGANTKLYMEEFFNRNSVDHFSAILLDIDEFKEINRAYGYKQGDEVLKAFVSFLYTLLPENASLIRMGGAEFLIVLHKQEEFLEKSVEKIFRACREKRYLIDNEVINITLSMSALDIPEGTVEIQHVLRLLDESLMKIKSRGKNDYVLLNIATYRELKHRDIDYIKKALDEERVSCLYQPIFHARTKKVSKFEALVRLVDEKDTAHLVSPDKFIHAIKRTNYYLKMSKLVLRDVFAMLERYPEIELSVNLDLDDLYNHEMIHMIMEYLYEHKTLAPRLTFEITEENEIHDYERANFIFNRLREYGSKIAIDDFGSGYSNYNYMIRLDVDILKIDGSLIRELEHDNVRAREVIASIKALSDRFGYELIAEYVTSEKIYDEVCTLGIGLVQGYYLGIPKKLDTYMEE